MGNPKFPRKRYTTPLHPWKEDRIKSERELLKKYGLKNHKEVWKAKTGLGKYRHKARGLLARMGAKDPQVKKESEQLLLHLTRIGVLPAGSSLDDVLALETESVLSRRLQTLVYLKGLSTTPDHSRQLINHGHIAIDNKKVTIPGYTVTKDEENKIGYIGKSPLNELSHPARPKTDVYKTGITPTGEKKTEEPKEKPDIKEEKDKETKETTKPKDEYDKKEEKNKETKDIKEKIVESAEKPEEKTETSKDPKEETTKEKPTDDKGPTTPTEKQEEQPKGKEEDTVKESKEKTVVTKETTKQMKQPENVKEEKTEHVEKPETKETKKPNEKEGGK